MMFKAFIFTDYLSSSTFANHQNGKCSDISIKKNKPAGLLVQVEFVRSLCNEF